MGKYKRSTPEQRTRLYLRFVNIRSHIVSARRERNRILLLAGEIGLNLDGLQPPREILLEDKIADRLINKRVLSELLAGNQLSITNRYTPLRYAKDVQALESLVVWWVQRMVINKTIIIDTKKLNIRPKQ